MQRDNRRLGSFPIGWVRPSRCTGWVKSPGYNLPPWTTPSKAGPETGREPNRPREGTPARPAAGPPGGRARGMENRGWRIEDGESRMVRSLRSLDGESRIVHRESWGRGDTRLGSGKRSAPPLAPPRRFLISPSSRLPRYDLVVSSSHRFIGTTYNEAAFPPSRTPPPPGTTNPPRLPLEKGRAPQGVDLWPRVVPTSKVRVYLSPPSHPTHPTRPNKKAGAPSEGSARFLRLRHARQQGWSRQGRG